MIWTEPQMSSSTEFQPQITQIFTDFFRPLVNPLDDHLIVFSGRAKSALICVICGKETVDEKIRGPKSFFL